MNTQYMLTGLSPIGVHTRLLSNENNIPSIHGSAAIKASIKKK
jgi:hypothetical protein